MRRYPVRRQRQQREADDPKVKKSIPSRARRVCMIADDAFAFADAGDGARPGDARRSARSSRGVRRRLGRSAGQVDVQLAAERMPVVNAAYLHQAGRRRRSGGAHASRRRGGIECRTAVAAVTPECAYSRIAGMREILTAGKSRRR
ncbi:MAG: hypothetical protein ACLTMP_12785 [Eggerthella lenta]